MQEITDAAVRSFLVVVGHPIGELLRDLPERHEERVVEQLVTKPSVEALPSCPHASTRCAAADNQTGDASRRAHADASVRAHRPDGGGDSAPTSDLFQVPDTPAAR
jgi:hypothetical protein